MRPLSIIEDEVKELVRQRGVDPSRTGHSGVERLIEEVLVDYERRMQTTDLPRIEDRRALRKALVDRIAGFGRLQPLMDDPHVEEIWINAPGKVFCAREGRHVLTNVVLSSDEIRDLVERMLRTSGRRLDLSTPSLTRCSPMDHDFTLQSRISLGITGRSTSGSSFFGHMDLTSSCDLDPRPRHCTLP